MGAEIIIKPGNLFSRKYLICWNLKIESKELTKISRKPALDKALNYVQDIAEKNYLEIYRFVSEEESTIHEVHPPGIIIGKPVPYPSGIAIVKAKSIEEANKIVQSWIEGLSYGGNSITDYLEYEIKPLVEISRKRRL